MQIGVEGGVNVRGLCCTAVETERLLEKDEATNEARPDQEKSARARRRGGEEGAGRAGDSARFV